MTEETAASPPLPDAPPPDVPKVILCTPYYGGVSMGLRQTLNQAVKDRRLISVAMEVQSTTSVLPQCFNQMLAIALDARDQGRVTHLAMAHADIVAEPGWLDVLWSEMWFRGADLISAVVPIKNASGRTSTAIGLETDPWAVLRCIRLADRATLPPTFGPESVCGPGEVLLVNTGLMLADIRKPWWDDFAFEFHTRLRKTSAGRLAECRSEDWAMSHALHKVGAKVLATWKPRLRHEGSKMYPNYVEGD
jgi:hypothetical protein